MANNKSKNTSDILEEIESLNNAKLKSPDINVPNQINEDGTAVYVPENTEGQSTTTTNSPGQELVNRLKADPSTPAFWRMFGDDYFEKEKEKKKQEYELQQKRERAKMTASALANTLRLIGHGFAINKGAYETPWGDDKNITTGLQNLDKYRGEYLAAIQRLEDIENADKSKAKQMAWQGKMYQDKQRRLDDETAYAREIGQRNFDYKQDRDKVSDDFMREKLDIEWAKLNRLLANDAAARNGSGSSSTDDGIYTLDTPNYVYNIQANNPTHRSALAEMISKKMGTLDYKLKNLDLDAMTEQKLSAQYEALKKLMSQDWPKNFASVMTRLPYVWDDEIAQKYGIPSQKKTNAEEEFQQNGGSNGAFLDNVDRIAQWMAISKANKDAWYGTSSTQSNDINTNASVSNTNSLPTTQQNVNDNKSSEKQSNTTKDKERLKRQVLKLNDVYSKDPTEENLRTYAMSVLNYNKVTRRAEYEKKLKQFGSEKKLLEAIMNSLRKK